MFISDPTQGVWFIAERATSRSQGRANGLRWSTMPVEPTAADTRVNASQVPHEIRREAYRHFEKQRRAFDHDTRTAIFAR